MSAKKKGTMMARAMATAQGNSSTLEDALDKSIEFFLSLTEEERTERELLMAEMRHILNQRDAVERRIRKIDEAVRERIDNTEL